jgi:hypothetical protein
MYPCAACVVEAASYLSPANIVVSLTDRGLLCIPMCWGRRRNSPELGLIGVALGWGSALGIVVPALHHVRGIHAGIMGGMLLVACMVMRGCIGRRRAGDLLVLLLRGGGGAQGDLGLRGLMTLRLTRGDAERRRDGCVGRVRRGLGTRVLVSRTAC